MACRISQRIFLKEYEVEVIHNGIDLNIFKPVGSVKSFMKNENEP